MTISSEGSVLVSIGLAVSQVLVASDVWAQEVSFIASRDFAVESFPRSVAVGDFNGDGIPDLAVANSQSFFSTGYVSVLLGNGDGTFQPARNLDVGRSPYSVAVGDFNGDGKLDLAVANYNSHNVSVLLG